MERGALEIRLLGLIEAARGGVAIKLGGPRQRGLLALLAASVGRGVAADRIVDLLWAGEPPEASSVTLRSYVSRLRLALGDPDAVRSSAGGYMLAIPPEQVDAVQFERLVREAEEQARRHRATNVVEAARRALALWRGDPFGGLGEAGLLEGEIARLDELRLRALELRFEAELELGAGAAIVEELETQVREHPYREVFWRQLMLALYRAERQADALAAYHRARAALDEGLGVDPGRELQALESAILRQEVPSVAPSRRRDDLPVPISSFIGREQDVARVAMRLDQVRLLTLTGVGGVGKTRLAIEAAREAAPRFAGGVVFADLAPLADAERIAGNLADLLELREQAGVTAIDRVLAHLADLELLLVLDNCEHLREACADLAARLLGKCPDLRILATSREALGIPGEAEEAVRPLALPGRDDDLVTAREADAVRLFLARARAARGTLQDDDALVASVIRICSDLDGLPLGIELAAARARVLSTTEIADRLNDRFRFLVSWRRVASTRHRTLREAMDWSFDLLDEQAQRLLGELSVFAGSFTLEAVAGIRTEADAAGALEVLSRLVDASLVVVEHDVEPTRYRLLETVRQYGAERLEANGRTREVRERHVRHFAAYAQAAWQPIRSVGMREAWIARLALDRENLRAALTWSGDLGLGDAMLQIAEALWWYWWVRGEVTEGRAWLLAGIDAAGGADRLLVARAHLGAAGLAWTQGDLDAAQRHGETAASSFEQLGDRFQAGSAYNTLGLIATGRGALEDSAQLFQRATELFEAADVEPDQRNRNLAVAIDNIGTVALESGDIDQALARYREALERNRTAGDREGVAMNELHIAAIESERAAWSRAREHLAQALVVYRETSFHHYVVECLEVAAAVANGMAEPELAARLLGASDGLRGQLGLHPVPFMGRLREREAATARSALSDAEYERARAAGASAPIDRVLAEADAFLTP